MITVSDFRRYLNFNDINFEEGSYFPGVIDFYMEISINPVKNRQIEIQFKDNGKNKHVSVFGFETHYYVPGFEEEFIKELNDDKTMIYKFDKTGYDEVTFVSADLVNDSTLTMDYFVDILKLGIKQLNIAENFYMEAVAHLDL